MVVVSMVESNVRRDPPFHSEHSWSLFNDTSDDQSDHRGLHDILALLEIIDFDNKGKTKSKVEHLADRPYLQFYTGQKGIMHMFYKQVDEYVRRRQYDKALILSAISSSINRLRRICGETLNLNIRNGQLCDLLPHSQPGEFEKRAEQLKVQERYLHAAAYFFRAFQPDQGVDCLLRATNIRDAAMASRLYFPLQSEILKQSYQQWINSLIETGRFESAAKCLISLGNPWEAGSVLLRRKSDFADRIALRLLMKGRSGDLPEDIAILALSVIRRHLNEFNWRSLEKLIRICPSFHAWGYVSRLHEGLSYLLSQHSFYSVNSKPCLFVTLNNFNPRCLDFGAETFMESLRNYCLAPDTDDFDGHCSSAITYFLTETTKDYAKLNELDTPDGKNLSRLLPYCAINLCLGLLTASKDPNESRKYIRIACQSLVDYPNARSALLHVLKDENLEIDGQIADTHLELEQTVESFQSIELSKDDKSVEKKEIPAQHMDSDPVEQDENLCANQANFVTSEEPRAVFINVTEEYETPAETKAENVRDNAISSTNDVIQSTRAKSDDTSVLHGVERNKQELGQIAPLSDQSMKYEKTVSGTNQNNTLDIKVAEKELESDQKADQSAGHMKTPYKTGRKKWKPKKQNENAGKHAEGHYYS